jgi:hypothetical protein
MMTEAVWLACTDPEAMLKFLQGKGSDRKLRWFACACVRRVCNLVGDDDSHRAITIAENLADGLPTFGELSSPPLVCLTSHTVHNHPVAWTANDYADAAAGDAVDTDPERAAHSAAEMTRYAVDPDLYDAPGKAQAGREAKPQADLLRDIFGNPFRPQTFSSEWQTDTAVTLARQMYESREFSAMPILADALQDGGCDDATILDHCRGPGPHVRGCWVVDLVLGKE